MAESTSRELLPTTALKQVLRLLRPYRVQVFLCFILVLLPSYFKIWSPFLLGRLIDDGIIGRNIDIFLQLTVALILIKVIVFFLSSSVSYCLSRFGLQILVDYRDQLLSRLLRYPMSFFDRISSGSLTTRLTSDINSVQELFSTALIPLVGNLLLMVGIAITMFLVRWDLALLSLCGLPFLLWLTLAFDRRLRRRFGFMRRSLSSMSSFAGESFSGHREVKVLGATDEVTRDFESLSRRLRDRFTQAVREYALYNPLVPFLTAMMELAIIVYGGWQVTQSNATVGELVTFLGYVSLLAWPIREFAEKYTILQQALAAVDRLVDISQQVPEADSGELQISQPMGFEFRDVSFQYAATKSPAIAGLNFSVRPGERVALMGETGSGKTTTCSLLMRFYEPQAGRILLNGHDLTTYSLESLRSQIGWVSQDVFLFSRSLRENLALGAPVSDDELWEALKLVRMEKWAQGQDGGLDHVFVERASSVSSGQRQLLSLARAIVRKPRLLIFDEATSYIDSLTEAKIQEALEALWDSREFVHLTSFFIAHRLSTLKRCNKLLVFRSGQIVESGTWDELMSLDGYAATLYREQFGAKKSVLTT